MASDTTVGTLHLPTRTPTPAAEAPAPVARTALKAAPAIRNVYWCRFSDAAVPPEFSKKRPVIVVSYENSLTGPILVLPITTEPQPGNLWAVKLERNPSPGENCDVWAVCNHLYTVACVRLTATHGTVPRLTPAEFRPIHELVLRWLPTLPPIADNS
jgi:mRNA interferase MazF